MKKATIIIGKDEQNEEYALLIDRDYISFRYNNSRKDHEDFLNNISTEFAKTICKDRSTLEVGVLNGFKLDEGEGIVKIGKINYDKFSSMLKNRINALCDKNSIYLPPLKEGEGGLN